MAKESTKNQQKREHAYMLYVKEGITVFKIIAERVGATPHTISKWAAEDKWEKRRQNMFLTREEQMQNLLIELEELSEFIKAKPEGQRFADAKQADIRRKLIKDIKDLETKASISEIIQTAQRFIKWLSPIDHEQAKVTTQLFDAFIKDCLK